MATVPCTYIYVTIIFLFSSNCALYFVDYVRIFLAQNKRDSRIFSNFCFFSFEFSLFVIIAVVVVVVIN